MTAIGTATFRDEAATTRFYEERFKRGYMGDWSAEKCERVRKLVKSLPLPPTGTALDFGCGVGVFTAVLQDALPRWLVEGTDLSSTAVNASRQRVPECMFYPLSECGQREDRFDFIFTHHVLEHVIDINGTARLLSRLARSESAMLHILPCGDPGSFEQRLCLARKEGFRTEIGQVFFFEEEGHLRRLDTDGLLRLWTPDGFRMARAWYGSHYFGAIEARTRFDLGSVLRYADPSQAIDAHARRRLARLRAGLVTLWLLRKPLTTVRDKRRFGRRGVRDHVLYALGLATLPLSKCVDLSVKYMAAREWSRRNSEKGGSEMYIYLTRP